MRVIEVHIKRPPVPPGQIHGPLRSTGLASRERSAPNVRGRAGQITSLGLDGCKLIRPASFVDERGTFVKSFEANMFRTAGLPTEWAETYYSTSRRGVVRGLHLQKPPAQLGKLVWCVAGRVWDVILDLRRSSATFGRHISFELSCAEPVVVYVAPGCAHGFLSYQDDSTVMYQVTSAYSPAHDVGVRWDSAGISWPTDNPIVSDRDKALPNLCDFLAREASDYGALSSK